MASDQNIGNAKRFSFPSLLTAPLAVTNAPENYQTELFPYGAQTSLPLVNPIYEKVLEFPSDTEHLKYFGYNPHPDKIPDESLLFSAPFLYEDLNEPLLKKQIQFHVAKDRLWPYLSDKERCCFCLRSWINISLS